MLVTASLARFTFRGLRPSYLSLLLLPAALWGAACDEPADKPPPAAQPAQPDREKRRPGAREDSRFMKIRALLEEPPASRQRAVELFPLVKPLCEDEKERRDFLETAAWSASLSSKDLYITKTLAADTIEHVATTCFRSHPEATMAFLGQAKKKIPGTYRFDLVRARLAAAAGDLETAAKAARAAKEAGSIHALALLANIEAQSAREAGVGYRKGMLDRAIATVSAEPDGQWPLVDLAAVLSTRARLLTERAVWEEGDQAKRTMLLANAAYMRLARPPFIENIRKRAADVLCFNAVVGEQGAARCKGAAERTKNLGAARMAEIELDDGFDRKRLAALEALKGRIETLPEGKVVIVVARGDESELIEWARPAARLLAAVQGRSARIIAVNRTQSPRARALFRRILELSGIEPELFIDADTTFAMPCLTAVVAERRTPKACPFDRSRQKKLEKMTDVGFAVLVGRDLDAEIDDLHLYDLDAVLLSFRESRMEKGIDAWLKSVSDVFILAPPPS